MVIRIDEKGVEKMTQKLFSRNVNGVLLEWSIEQLENRYRVISGQIEGEKVTGEWIECFGKNVGKV